MKKLIILSALSMIFSSMTFAQTQTNSKGKVGQKIVDVTEKIANTTSQAADGVERIAHNVARIFEPFRKRYQEETHYASKGSTDQYQASNEANAAVNTTTGQGSNSQSNTQQTIESTNAHAAVSADPSMSSGMYNNDGTANLGTQNHSIFGNYLDMNKGEILDNVSAPAVSESVDLIFTATKWGGQTLYAFFSPYFAKNVTTAMKYNYGSKYKRNEKHPATNWEVVNESQVALTNLNEAQFNKFQTSKQLEAFVKQVQNFKESIEIQNTITGKVLAIKTQMNNRTCYGLLYIAEQFGTVGENSYIKVKLKVLGSDLNGDGYPD